MQMMLLRTLAADLEVRSRSILEEYTQRNWTTDHGLPSNEIQSMIQTRDGYLWVATRRGLARFDGVKFTVYIQANTPQMVSNDCRALLEDSDGNLWIGTMDGLLMKNISGFTRFGTDDGLFEREVTALYESRNGGVWAGSYGGVSRVENGKIVGTTSEPDNYNG